MPKYRPPTEPDKQPEPAGWVAWTRVLPKEPWHALAEYCTEADARKELDRYLVRAAKRGQTVSSIILPVGERPDKRKGEAR